MDVIKLAEDIRKRVSDASIARDDLRNAQSADERSGALTRLYFVEHLERILVKSSLIALASALEGGEDDISEADALACVIAAYEGNVEDAPLARLAAAFSKRFGRTSVGRLKIAIDATATESGRKPPESGWEGVPF